MDLTGYVLERLREDADFVLYRGRRPETPGSVLILASIARINDAAGAERMEKEFALADLLDPAWAVQPTALSRRDGRTVLVLSDPGGRPLDTLLGQPLDLARFLTIAVGLAAALREAHGAGLIHRDIKPAHAFVDDTGGVRLTGFGVATQLPRDRHPLAAGEIIAGTLAYMAPEQTGRFNRSIDSRADLYALGVTLYEMLVGALPFAASTPAEWIHCHIARLPPPPCVRVDGVPPWLDALILRLLAKNSEDRYQTAVGLERDLRRACDVIAGGRNPDQVILGNGDYSDRLLIPEKLYGRDAEVQALTAAFARVAAEGSFSVAVISGYSGVGKSAVADEFKRWLHGKSAWFAAGKLDPQRRSIPYATFAGAFRGLLRQLLSLDDASLASWRHRLLAAVGSNGLLMVEVFPDLELILGPQAPPAAVSPQEARNRFDATFRRFIGVFAQATQPLVLFLDDLQWFDRASLDLLKLLADEGGIANLLVVSTCRSNDLSAAQEFEHVLETIGAAGALLEIRLEPLSVAHVGRLIADALHARPAVVAPLAELVFQKTQGNPFFTIQFLTTLHAEGLLAFNAAAGAWQWQIERIRAKGITDSVAELMGGRLARYTGTSLAVILQLSCLGDSAGTDVLSRLLDLPEAVIDAAMREAVGAGLVDRVDFGYAFAHDGVREAAYQLVPEAERPGAHLRIGRELLKGLAGPALEDAVFEITSHLNRGASLIFGHDERLRLAALNLDAGKRANAAAAYSAALAYLNAGCALLPRNSWTQHFRLTFDLERYRAECNFMVGEVSFAEERLDTLSARCQTPDDRALIVSRQTMLYTYVGRVDRAAELSLALLARMGVVLPIAPTPHMIDAEYLALMSRLGSRPIAGLVDLPPMTDPHWRLVMDVMEGLMTSSAILSDDLQMSVILRMSNIAVEHGNCDESAHAFAALGGLVMGWRCGSFEEGHAFGEVALRLSDEFGHDRYAARIYAVVSGTVGPFSLHLRACYDLAIRAVELGSAQGGITYSGYSWGCALTALLDSGRGLGEVCRQAEKALVSLRHAKFILVIEFLTVQLQLARALRGLTANLGSLSDAQFNEDAYERQVASAPYLWHAQVRYRIRKLQLLFYAGEHEACMELVAAIGETIPLKVFEVAEYRFFAALARASVLTGRARTARSPLAGALLADHARLTEWARLCPSNFAGRAALVGAEIARLDGHDLAAEQLYEEAVRLSRDHGFIQNEALAYELAARFYHARGFGVTAEAYLRNARSAYLRWGADSKVRQLDRLYPHVHDGPSRRQDTNVARVAWNERIDLAAMIEMHQAVSGELVLDRLIERLMVMTVEHAGAVRGLILLPRNGEMRLVAEAVAGHQAVAVTFRDSGDLAGDLPMSIMNLVARTREALILDDASGSAFQAGDPYILAVRPRSVLCLPLVKQSVLVGILYLENNLSSHIFTPERLSVLRLLASQAAISIENARLFQDIQNAQDEARRVNDEIRRSFDMMPALAWRAAADGQVEFANKQWHDYTGVKPQDLGERWLTTFHPDDAERVAERWRHLIAFGVSGEVEGRMRRFDGEFRRFLVRANPMRDEQGVIVKWHGTNTDIEEIKQAERAHETLARASRVTALGELTVSIAHEVNQPLMAIVTNAATCLRWLAEERFDLVEARRAAERIIRDGHRAGDIIASIRALAKKSPPVAVKLDISGVIEEVLVLLRDELERYAILTETVFAGNACFVLGDRVQMQQVVVNLIMNGIEAIGVSGNARRVLRVLTAAMDSGLVSVAVCDTGDGVAASDGVRIFDPFYTTKAEGVGMGLSICRSIVESHGGRLSVSSNWPAGSIFEFTVPAYREEAEIAPAR